MLLLQRYYSLVLPVVAGLMAACLWLPGCSRQDSRPAPATITLPAKQAGGENSKARRKWEQKRLRDPQTGEIPAGIRRMELEFAAELPGARYRDQVSMKPGAATVQGLDWIGRGPGNIGGRTRALGIDVSNPNTILAGGVSGGMWRSSDGGANWQRTTGRDQLPSVTCITQDVRPGKTNVWYYGAGEGRGNSVDFDYYGYGLYKSTDSGRTWSVMPSTAFGSRTDFDSMFDIVWNVAVDPSNVAQDELYVAGAGVIMRSADGGATWTKVLGSSAKANTYTDVVVTAQGVVYAAIGGITGGAEFMGIHRSTDGITWTRISQSIQPVLMGRIRLAVTPANPDVLWVLAETPGRGNQGSPWESDWNSLWRYTYISGNGVPPGGQWTDRSQNMPPADGDWGGYRSQGGYNMVIAVHPLDENLVVIGGTNLYRSTNAFATNGETTWIGGYRRDGIGYINYDYPNHHPDQHAVAFMPGNPRVMFTGSDGGVHRTDDILASTVRWTPLNRGYVTSQFYAVAIDPSRPHDNTIMGGMQDNGTWHTKSASGMEPWKNLLAADGGFCAIAEGGRVYYASAQQGATFRGVMNPDGTLQSYTRVDPAAATGLMFIQPWAIDPNAETMMYYGGSTYLWRNDNLAEIPFTFSPTEVNWSMLPGTRVQDQLISAVSVSRANPAHRVYFGTDEGELYRVDNANATPQVTRLGAGQLPTGGYVNCIAVHPGDADRAIAVFSNYRVISLYATTDGGATWTPVAGNLEENPNGSGSGPSCRWAEIVPVPGGTLYLVGTSTGLYSATELNGMNTVWTQEGSATIGNVAIDMIRSRPSDGLIVVATHGNGIFSANTATSGVGGGNDMAGFRLEQNVPNPARNSARIRFEIPAYNGAAVPVRLDVHDARGALVRTLVDEPLLPGEHTLDFDLRDGFGNRMAGGAYHYRLNVGGHSATRTMIVTR